MAGNKIEYARLKVIIALLINVCLGLYVLGARDLITT